MALRPTISISSSAASPRAGRVSALRMAVSSSILLGLLIVATLLLVGRWDCKMVISASMYPTLRRGEYVFIDRKPKPVWRRGAVVIFAENDTLGELVVKRLIALGGDRVEWREGRLFVNGEELRQIDPPDHADPEFATWVAGRPGEPDHVWNLREGEVFVIGDNWGASQDSFSYGPAPEAALLGEARLVYWPWGAIRFIH